jgi:hypothetical protein
LGDASGKEGRIPRECVKATGFIGKVGVIVAVIDGGWSVFSACQQSVAPPSASGGKKVPSACRIQPASEKLPKPLE